MKETPQIMPGAEAYYLPGVGAECVVMVHGYTGTPGELRLLGDYLNKLGFGVIGVRLPGHGTTVEDLEKTTFSDWYEEVVKNVSQARTAARHVSIIGTSMGAAVVLKAAANLPVHKTVVMSTPIKTYNKHYQYAEFFHFFHPVEKKKPRKFDVPAKYYESYNEFPLLPLGSAFREINRMPKDVLPKITCPILIMQSTVEKHVKPESAQIIYDNVSSTDKEIVWYHHSGHILALDSERNDVYKRIAEFLAK
jgi:carboxylesterase